MWLVASAAVPGFAGRTVIVWFAISVAGIASSCTQRVAALFLLRCSVARYTYAHGRGVLWKRFVVTAPNKMFVDRFRVMSCREPKLRSENGVTPPPPPPTVPYAGVPHKGLTRSTVL